MAQQTPQSNRQPLHRYAVLAAFGGLLLAVDQFTKYWALARFDGVVAPVTPFFNFVLVWNPGVSFGMFQNHDGTTGPYILIGLALAIVTVMAIWLARAERRGQQWALAAVIAGAIGNVIDRAIHGAVIDFLDFHAFGYHWPAFNVADCAVVCGIAFLVIDSLFFEPKPQDKTGQDEDHA